MPKRSCGYTQTICRLYPNWNVILNLSYPSYWMYRCSKASASIQATPSKTQRAASFWGRTNQKVWYSNPATGWHSWWIWLMMPRLGEKGYGSTSNSLIKRAGKRRLSFLLKFLLFSFAVSIINTLYDNSIKNPCLFELLSLYLQSGKYTNCSKWRNYILS